MALDVGLIKIFKEIAEELDIDINIVSLSVTSVFKFITIKMKENIATQEDATITLNFLGKFKVKKSRRKAININLEKKSEYLVKLAKKSQ